MPPGQSSAIDSPIVSSWFALRAAVLRLAVSPWRFLFGERLRTVAAAAARAQNQPMSGPSAELLHHAVVVVVGAAEKCKLGTVSAVRANPSLKRTRTGIRSAWPISWCHAARLPVRAA